FALHARNDGSAVLTRRLACTRALAGHGREGAFVPPVKGERAVAVVLDRVRARLGIGRPHVAARAVVGRRHRERELRMTCFPLVAVVTRIGEAGGGERKRSRDKCAKNRESLHEGSSLVCRGVFLERTPAGGISCRTAAPLRSRGGL